MGLGRYVVEAVLLEGRSPTEIAGSHGISRSWIYELVRRFREGGYEALEPRSRRPHSCSHQVSADVQAAILGLRQELIAAGHDAGARTIAHHLQPLVEQVPSTATIWRILCRQGQITPQPRKRPKSSLHRFQAALPNELWQLDITYWQLTGGRHAEILNLIDDHSRLLLASDAFFTVKAADVVETFHLAGQSHGFPAALLSDNGAVFAGRPRRGKVLLESELQRLGIACKHSLPNHPQTCGKVERLHQTLKRFLDKQAPARSLAHLQLQLDAFRTYYNQVRPHRATGGQTPLAAFNARLTARPALAPPPVHFRVRRDRVDAEGRVTLRYLSRLRHIAVGKAYKRQRVTLLVADDDVRVVDKDGFLIRQLTLDPARNYQPLGTQNVHHVLRQASGMS